ncbi:hypothetical protein F4678DRAFT_473256 [Xylaria arbuscula]|nr:hypothetical protein F4678DRAFT_473256 [Xylaria arbuscula]
MLVSNKTSNNGDDHREVHELCNLLKHRMSGGNRGAVELLVHWVGESEAGATWEAEDEIRQNAAETLYSYWKAQGGRQSVLFHKPKHPLDEMYHVFKVLRHKKRRQGFQLEVQWVGHSTEPHETTMEPETKIQSIAPALLDQYWGRVGGRASYLGMRNRANRPGLNK